MQTLKIIQKSQAAYFSISNYSDVGDVIVERHGVRLTNKFKIHLARPNFYRIEWSQIIPAKMVATTNSGVAWCAGDGDFVEAAGDIQKMTGIEAALAAATGISSMASFTIPTIFFNLQDTSDLDMMETESAGTSQSKDEDVGTNECFVVTGSQQRTNGNVITTSLWIGKNDYLVHQAKTIVKHAGFQPELTTIFMENHGSIIVNKPFDKADFVR